MSSRLRRIEMKNLFYFCITRLSRAGNDGNKPNIEDFIRSPYRRNQNFRLDSHELFPLASLCGFSERCLCRSDYLNPEKDNFFDRLNPAIGNLIVGKISDRQSGRNVLEVDNVPTARMKQATYLPLGDSRMLSELDSAKIKRQRKPN